MDDEKVIPFGGRTKLDIPVDFDTVLFGRLCLADGTPLRLFFTPDGLKIAFEENAVKNGAAIILKSPDSNTITGLKP